MGGLPEIEVAVIGGSGLESLFDAGTEVELETPFGPPSAPISVGLVGETLVGFLPRHGPGHVLPPHRVNSRANVWALHAAGARRLLAPCAAGSLRADVHPGEIVVVDQLVDRTSGRPDTYFDGPDLHHAPFADPYCPELRAAVMEAGRDVGLVCHEGGTVVVIQGPRFSTRAESSWYRAQGWDVVNMTQYPECVLARELGICYAGIAQVTDYDAGTADGTVKAVTQDSAFSVLEAMVDPLRRLIVAAIRYLPSPPACPCADRDRVATGWP